MTHLFKPTALAAVLWFALMPLNAYAEHHEDSSEQTRAIVVALFEAFNRHDVDALVALYDPDIKVFNPGYGEPQYGLEVVRGIYQGHFANIPDVYDKVQRIIVEGDLAAVEFLGTWAQPTEADPQARGSIRIGNFFRIKDGKIIEDLTYYDRMDLPGNVKPENDE